MARHNRRWTRARCGWLRVPASVCGAISALAQGVVVAADTLLDLPFEDLLQVEIRSAGKREEQIRDIPASVTILTREDIQRYGWVTFEELLRNVPGFFMLDDIGERYLGSRGVVGGGVQLLVNGVPQHQTRQKALTTPEYAAFNIPVESIDRIEVIRGPMSVVYGNNAFLGVINVVTNAIGQYGSRVSASYGSRDSGKLFARAGTETDAGYLVLNAGGYRTDGLDGAYADMMGPAQLAALVPGMHSSLDGHADHRDLSLDMSAGWGQWTADLRLTQSDFGFYIFSPGFEDGNRARLTTLNAGLGWEHRITENLGVRASAVFSEERLDAYEYDFLSPALDGDQQEHYRRWDWEVDLVWDPQPSLNLLAGYRFRLVGDIENRADVPPLVDLTNRVGNFGLQDLFTEIGWKPIERLRLVGGMRLSRLPNAYRYRSDDALTDTQIEREVPVDDRTLLTGRVAALWSLDPHQVVKLIWGTAAQDNDQIQFSEPERIATTELVYVRTGTSWTLSGSLFRNHITRIVRTIQKADPNTLIYQTFDDNSGEWLTHGLELTAELHPVTGLNLSASTTWQHTEDRKTGIDPGYSPALLLKLKADYTQGPLTLGAYAHYVSGMEADWNFAVGPTPGITQRIGERVDPYWNLGVNVRYRPLDTGLIANLNVSNLLDTEIRYPANELANFSRGLIGPGRVFTATIGWEF